MKLSWPSLVVLLTLLSSGCGMKTALMGGNSFAINAGSSGGGASSSSGSGSGSSSGSGTGSSSSGSSGGIQAPPAAKIVANPTLAFTFLTTAPTSLGLANGAVVNAADYSPTVAAGGLAVVVATSLPVTVPASDVTFPTTLDGLSVTVGGTAARLYLVAQTQVSFQIPPSLAPGSYPVVVSQQGGGTVLSATCTVAELAPAILTAANTGTGVATGETVSFNSANSDWEGAVIFAKSGSIFNPVPVASGNWLVLYGTGWMNHTGAVGVSVGTTELTPSYAGAQLSYPGLDELVVWIPPGFAGATTATETVELTTGNSVSNTVRVCIAGSGGGTCP